MNKTLAVLSALMFTATACSCASVNGVVVGEQARLQDELASTVQIEVQISATLKAVDPDTQQVVEVPMSTGWVGSGFVYEKTLGLTGPVMSKILTANHVLEAPAAGDELDTPLGKVHIDAVLMVVKTHTGKTCELQPLKLGVSDTHDVATGLALCDAGKVAKIASSVPEEGARVIVTGHPQGIWPAVITEGFVSGWYNGYLLISNGVYGGNSGGPVWYNGEVVGILVRSSEKYHHISLSVPLSEVLKRIDETP